MGKIKQLHIDCTNECCIVGKPETCYMIEKDYNAYTDEDWGIDDQTTTDTLQAPTRD